MKSRRDSHVSELVKTWNHRDNPNDRDDNTLANEYYAKIVSKIIQLIIERLCLLINFFV